MPNKFAGTCYRCGEIVAPGAGVFEKVSASQARKWPLLPRNKKWLTQHHDCAARWRGTNQHHVYANHETAKG